MYEESRNYVAKHFAGQGRSVRQPSFKGRGLCDPDPLSGEVSLRFGAYSYCNKLIERTFVAFGSPIGLIAHPSGQLDTC